MIRYENFKNNFVFISEKLPLTLAGYGLFVAEGNSKWTYYFNLWLRDSDCVTEHPIS